MRGQAWLLSHSERSCRPPQSLHHVVLSCPQALLSTRALAIVRNRANDYLLTMDQFSGSPKSKLKVKHISESKRSFCSIPSVSTRHYRLSLVSTNSVMRRLSIRKSQALVYSNLVSKALDRRIPLAVLITLLNPQLRPCRNFQYPKS